VTDPETTDDGYFVYNDEELKIGLGKGSGS
jgi:hypothetical protein